MRSGKPDGRQPIKPEDQESGIRRQDTIRVRPARPARPRVLTAWWLQRGVRTRSHPELGRENPQRRWYCMVTCGRVGRRQAFKTHGRQVSDVRYQG